MEIQKYMFGVLQACVTSNLSSKSASVVLQAALAGYSKMQKDAAAIVIPGAKNLADPATWAPPGKVTTVVKTAVPSAAVTATPAVKTANDLPAAPQPNRYNFHMDETVNAIRRRQQEYASKKQKEAERVAYYAGTAQPAGQQPGLQ